MPISFAMGTLGALLGVWIAWSKSQVVVAVLPLLFGVIGGAGGYSLFKMDFSKSQNTEKLRIISFGLGSLCLACLTFMVLAVLTRPLLPQPSTQPDIHIMRSSSPLNAIIMRARLEALGATTDEIKLLLDAPQSQISSAETLAHIATAADDYLKAYNAVPPNDQTALEAGYQEVSPGSLAGWCKIFLIEMNALSTNGQKIDETHAAFLIHNAAINPTLKLNTLGTEPLAKLLSYPNVIAARIRLIDALRPSTFLALGNISSDDIKQADSIIQKLPNVERKGRDDIHQIADGPSSFL